MKKILLFAALFSLAACAETAPGPADAQKCNKLLDSIAQTESAIQALAKLSNPAKDQQIATLKSKKEYFSAQFEKTIEDMQESKEKDDLEEKYFTYTGIKLIKGMPAIPIK